MQILGDLYYHDAYSCVHELMFINVFIYEELDGRIATDISVFGN